MAVTRSSTCYRDPSRGRRRSRRDDLLRASVRPPPVDVDRAPAASAVSGPDGLVFSYPQNDLVFDARVRGSVRRVGTGQLTTERAQMALRSRYPTGDLTRQRDVLVGGARMDVWVAYRDGHGQPIPTAADWWTARGLARATLQRSGRLTGANPAMRRLLGTARSPGIRVEARELLPALADDLAGPLAFVLAAGEITGRVPGPALARNPGATCSGQADASLDYHLDWNAGGPGRHGLTLRSSDDRDAADERAAIAASSLAFIPLARRRDLLRRATRRLLRARERLPESIRSQRWIALVVAGTVRLYHVGDGTEQTVVYGRPGSMLGTHAAFSGSGSDDQTPAVALQSMTPSRLLLIDPGAVAKLVDDEPRFARALLEDCGDLLNALVTSYAARSTGSIAQRLARELLNLAEVQPGDLLIHVSEQQLADAIGTIRESVGRTISEFRRAGLVATTRSGVILTDVRRLRSAGDGSSVPGPQDAD